MTGDVENSNCAIHNGGSCAIHSEMSETLGSCKNLLVEIRRCVDVNKEEIEVNRREIFSMRKYLDEVHHMLMVFLEITPRTTPKKNE